MTESEFSLVHRIRKTAHKKKRKDKQGENAHFSSSRDDKDCSNTHNKLCRSLPRAVAWLHGLELKWAGPKRLKKYSQQHP